MSMDRCVSSVAQLCGRDGGSGLGCSTLSVKVEVAEDIVLDSAQASKGSQENKYGSASAGNFRLIL